MANGEGNMKVCIQSKKWIKPATSTPPHLHNHKLSSIDQLQSPIFIPLIFHFHNSETDYTVPTSHDQKLVRLEESLSQVLTLYYPFAGRYDHDRDETVICCQDQGLEFVVATVDRNLDLQLLDHVDRDVLFCGLEMLQSTSTPVVLVQVNVFSCGGLAIGVKFLHRVGDMFTLSSFMNAWATVCRSGSIDQLIPPNFNTCSLLPPKHYLHKPPVIPPSQKTPSKTKPEYLLKRYSFSGEAISTLKSKFNYTRVELVIALITRSLINVECCSRRDQKPRPLVMCLWMNLRSRTTLLPIEDNSCGNILSVVNVALPQENVQSLWELQDIVRLVRNSIRRVADDVRKVGTWSELGQKVEKEWMEHLEEKRKGDEKVNVLRFSSWCMIPLYEVDFGWGKPNLVSPIRVGGDFIFLMDCRDDSGGIDVWVNLKEKDMVHFQQEPDILAYSSVLT